MYLLDTDVASQRTKKIPVPAVMTWLSAVPDYQLHLSVITIEEVRAGAESLPFGQRRSAVERWLENDLLVRFAGRILPVDIKVADLCGRLLTRVKMQGHTPDLEDALIAATALVHDLKVATLNRKHFDRFGVELVDF